MLNNVQNTWNQNQQKFDDVIEMDQSNDQIVFDFPEFELQTDDLPKNLVVVKNSNSQINLTEKIVKTHCVISCEPYCSFKTECTCNNKLINLIKVHLSIH